ncbi:MAG TPA: DUF1653 domain-containing protein [Verrucomicrobiae bacterium]|nr:DUF1653 domain-containing protein [Verrucomicrobiae bacterium]
MEKIPYDQLIDTLAAARIKVTPGTHWRHYKGNEYLVKDIVLIEATNEVAVLYASLEQPAVAFVRPFTSWHEQVDIGGRLISRFSKATETTAGVPIA